MTWIKMMLHPQEQIRCGECGEIVLNYKEEPATVHLFVPQTTNDYRAVDNAEEYDGEDVGNSTEHNVEDSQTIGEMEEQAEHDAEHDEQWGDGT